MPKISRTHVTGYVTLTPLMHLIAALLETKARDQRASGLLCLYGRQRDPVPVCECVGPCSPSPSRGAILEASDGCEKCCVYSFVSSPRCTCHVELMSIPQNAEKCSGHAQSPSCMCTAVKYSKALLCDVIPSHRLLFHISIIYRSLFIICKTQTSKTLQNLPLTKQLVLYLSEADLPVSGAPC